MITESNFEQSESSSKMAMMAETTETRVIMTEISEDNDNGAAETMLARKHLAQKHYYPSDKAHGADIPQSCIESQTTSLAVEAAVAIVINGIHYAVLMASPYQLEYLAVGFLFSEGLIQHSHELLDWEVTHLTDIASYQKFAQSLNDGDLESASIEQRLEQFQDYDIYVVELVLNQRCHQRIQAQKRQLAGRTGCGMCGITGLTQALPDLSAYTQDRQPIQAACPRLDYLLDMR